MKKTNSNGLLKGAFKEALKIASTTKISGEETFHGFDGDPPTDKEILTACFDFYNENYELIDNAIQDAKKLLSTEAGVEKAEALNDSFSNHIPGTGSDDIANELFKKDFVNTASAAEKTTLKTYGMGISLSFSTSVGFSVGGEVILYPKPASGQFPDTRLWAGLSYGIGTGADGLGLEFSFWINKVPMTGHITFVALDLMLPMPEGSSTALLPEGMEPAMHARLMFIRQPTMPSNAKKITKQSSPDQKSTEIPEWLKFNAISLALGVGVTGVLTVKSKTIEIVAPGGGIARSVMAHQWANPRRSHTASLKILNLEPGLTNEGTVQANEANKLQIEVGNKSGGTVTFDSSSEIKVTLPSFLNTDITISDVSSGFTATMNGSNVILTRSGSFEWADKASISFTLNGVNVTASARTSGATLATVSDITGTTFNVSKMMSAAETLTVIVQTIPIQWEVDIDADDFTLVSGVTNGIRYNAEIGMSAVSGSIIPLIVDDTDATPVTATQVSDPTIIWQLGCQYYTVEGLSGDQVQQLCAVWYNGGTPNKQNLKSGNVIAPPSPLAANISTCVFPTTNDSLAITANWQDQ